MAKENDLTLGRKFTCTEMYIEALRKRACFESETMYGWGFFSACDRIQQAYGAHCKQNN